MTKITTPKRPKDMTIEELRALPARSRNLREPMCAIGVNADDIAVAMIDGKAYEFHVDNAGRWFKQEVWL